MVNTDVSELKAKREGSGLQSGGQLRKEFEEAENTPPTEALLNTTEGLGPGLCLPEKEDRKPEHRIGGLEKVSVKLTPHIGPSWSDMPIWSGVKAA